MEIKELYHKWLRLCDENMKNELKSYSEKEIEDSFFKDLSFGTGGLRGIIGAGTNKLNIYTIGKATQGLANYIKKGSVVIGYDSRINSDIFAKKTAEVFAANGIRVYLFSRILPVPIVSYAVRYLNASCGVMITASHNTYEYNGYKVFGSDGCQITTKAAEEIQKEINQVDEFKDVKEYRGEEIKSVDEIVIDSYIEQIKNQSVLYGEKINKNVSIVYSPLNGTGLEPVTRVLKESGFLNITVVEEQKNPDGNFPTCPSPNPEIKEAMSLGIEWAKKIGADLLIATDPDCDRVGIAVHNNNSEYILFTANEIGLLLFDFICSQRIKHNTMPNNPIMCKTIVTTDLSEKVAKKYGVKTVNVLTGFKYIGELIGLLEKEGKEDNFIFGFEESYGFLSGGYVRDKDGVDAAFLIAEMFAYYKSRNISLVEKLEEIYNTYGYCLNTLHSYTFKGADGFSRMTEIMKELHKGLDYIGELQVLKVEDYNEGLNGLPKSDVLKFYLENNCSVVVRPSGTEPKLKTYICVNSETDKEAKIIENYIVEDLNKMINGKGK